MENTFMDYAGLVALFAGGGVVVWYFWSWIKGRFSK